MEKGAREDLHMAIEAFETQAKDPAIDPLVVYSRNGHFSPITDRAYFLDYHRLLVYTDEELTYYGTATDRQKLVAHYHEQIEQGLIYHGGQGGGYFGVDRGYFSTKEYRRKFATG